MKNPKPTWQEFSHHPRLANPRAYWPEPADIRAWLKAIVAGITILVLVLALLDWLQLFREPDEAPEIWPAGSTAPD